MTFEQLGGLGEFIGGLAVLASLVYVAREIRQNTRATKLATIQATLAAAQNVFDAPTRDRDLARVIRIGLADPASLNDDEYAQFRWWASLALRTIENLFVQYGGGTLDQETWIARSDSASNLVANPGIRRVWKDSSSGYRRDFQDWVASILDQQGSPGDTAPAIKQGASDGSPQRVPINS